MNTLLVLRSGRRLPSFAPLLFRELPVSEGTYPALPGASAALLEDRRTLVLTLLEPLPAWSEIGVGFSSHLGSRALLDITGQRVPSGFGFSTSGERDEEAPRVLATAPRDGQAAVPPGGGIRVFLDELAGLTTAPDAVRLVKDGQRWPGEMVIDGAVAEFRPSRALEAESDYTLEIEGIADLAGNRTALQSIRFHTGPESKAPSLLPGVTGSNLFSGDLEPAQALVFECSHPVRPASVSAVVALMGRPSRPYTHPVRVEADGTTIRVTPAIPWPASRPMEVRLKAQDAWGRSFSYTAPFRAGNGGDVTRPEVVSITPAPGTVLVKGQPIRLVFSEPMFIGSDAAGLTEQWGRSYGNPTMVWSDDVRTVTLVVQPNGLTYSDRLVVVASSDLVDLAGNPLRAVTARYPLHPEMPAAWVRRSITARWPPDNTPLNPRDPIVLAFSLPVDAATLNRSIWIMTQEGRAQGSWEVSLGGILATFRNQNPWPAGGTILVVQAEAVVQSHFQLTFQAPPRASGLRVVRSTLGSPLPANAAIEVEFSEEPPGGPGPLILQRSVAWGHDAVPCDESTPRPRVRRFTPRAPLAVGSYITLHGRTEGPLAGYWGAGSTINAPLPAETRTLRYRAPLPGADGVPVNARVSAVFSGSLNPLSVTEDTVRLLAGGKPLPCRYTVSLELRSVIATPFEPLPPNEEIEVRLAGIEDLLGTPLEPIAWNFRTGAALDLAGPKQLHVNAPVQSPVPGFDPQAPVRVEYDEPLDPAAFQNPWPGITPVWEFSPDLRTVSVVPVNGWERGKHYSLNLPSRDWSGNINLGAASVYLTAGFGADPEPLVLRAVSPYDGQAGVPVNVVFSALFNKPVPADALRTIRLTRNGEPVELANGKSLENGRYTFTPATALDPECEYELAVEGVRDLSGNPQTEPRTIRFRTGERFDKDAPTATFRFVSQDMPLRIRLSEPIDPTVFMAGRDLLTCTERRGQSAYTRAVPVSATWNEERLELTLRPKEELRIQTEYTIASTMLVDLSGNRVDLPGIRFQVPAQTDPSPTRVTISPPDGSADVPINVVMQVSFSRVVGTPPVRLYEDDRLVFTAPSASSAAVAISYALKPGLRYRIEADSFRDDFDNEVPAASSSFTAGAGADMVRPRLASSAPADGDAGVALETPLQLTFNEPVVANVTNLPTPILSRSMPARYNTTVDANRLTVAPYPGWPAASTVIYYIGLSSSSGIPALRDWAGNGLGYPVSIRFFTAAVNDPVPPVLESVNPPAGSTIPAHDATIELRFTKPVMLGSGGLQLFCGSEKAVVVTGVYSPDFRTVSFRLDAPENTRVTLVGTDAIRDNADNPIEPFSLEFTTGASTPFGEPQAELVEPKPSWNAPPDTALTVRFDRVMDAPSVISSFHVTTGGRNVTGSIDVREEGREYRFRPDLPFAPGARVLIYILPTAMDPQGRTYVPGPSGEFAIVQIAGESKGTVLTLARRGFAASAPADAALEVEFDREIDPASVNEDSVWLRRGRRMVPGRASVRGGRVVRFTPDAALEPGAEYVLTAGAALTAADGSTFVGQDLRFHATAPDKPPQIQSVETASWRGRSALRVRFTGALSPLAAGSFRVERRGKPVDAEVLPSIDGQEVWIVPRGDATGLSVLMEGAPARDGRILPARRIEIGVP